jgi:hypothetical protein
LAFSDVLSVMRLRRSGAFPTNFSSRRARGEIRSTRFLASMMNLGQPRLDT